MKRLLPFALMALACLDAEGGGPAIRAAGPGKAITFPALQYSGTPTSITVNLPATPCTCAALTVNPTGTPLNVTRAEVQACFKGNTLDHINNGDVVWCPANTVPVMYGADGGGDLGLDIWAQRTNPVFPSEALDDSHWIKDHAVVAVPTVTADVAIAPDNSQTADLLSFPAIASAGTQYSGIYQTTCPADNDVRQIFLRALCADGGVPPCQPQDTVPIYSLDGGPSAPLGLGFLTGAGSLNGSNCGAISSEYWTRCFEWDDAGVGVGTYFWFGAGANSTQTSPAIKVLAWEANCQNNTVGTWTPYPPPIRTDAGSVTRPQTVVEVSVIVPMWSDLYMSAQFVPEDGMLSGGGTPGVLIDLNDHTGTDNNILEKANASITCDWSYGGIHTAVTQGTFGSGGYDKLQCAYDGGMAFSACVNSTCSADQGLDAGVRGSVLLTVGSTYNGVNYIDFANGVIKDISVKQNARKTIELFGDSIVEGHTAGNPIPGSFGGTGWPQNLIHAQLGNRVAIQNNAVSGNTSLDQLTVWNRELAYVVDAGTAGRTYFMLQVGINDQPDAGGALGNIHSMLLNAEDAGVHVLCSTLTPDFVSASYVTQMNADLNSFCPANALPIADTFDAMQDPNSANHINPALNYNSDGVHPNDAGVQVEVNTWIPAGKWNR